MCVNVCMYVYMCVYVCVYVCIMCVYVCIYVCTYLYTPIAEESIYRKHSIFNRVYLKINGSRIHCLIIAESNQFQF